ncbi:response regulator [Salicibibacter cibi]|uniref:Circadian input-output histidine kinase CikA n=1 Tax=Salicibibacter cibi TaxID=2743001 RepID=A0A7T6ZE89_9BACI|nr:ATP-binding protein [Salicibibacter cibi]QQK81772.1 response regulator [Salicibibacter cibi]
MKTSKPMSKKNIFLIIVLFFLVLTGFRFGWLFYHEPPDHPQAEQGVVDLTDWDFTDDQAITLDGMWEFYPNEFIAPNSDTSDEEMEYISVPGDWSNHQENQSAYGYGTYRVNILLPDGKQSLYGIRMKSATSAGAVYIDGELMMESGTPAKNVDQAEGTRFPLSTIFPTESKEIELMIHASNYEIPFWGGLDQSLKIGTENAILSEDNRPLILQIVVGAIFLLHSLYAFSIYLLGKGKYLKEILFFGVMLLVHGLSILIYYDTPLQLPLDIIWYYKLVYFLYVSTLFSLLIFFKHMFHIKSGVYSLLLSLYIFIVIGEMVVPFDYFIYLGMVVAIFYILSIIFLFTKTIKIIRNNVSLEAIFILFFITAFTSHVNWHIFRNLGMVNAPYYPFDMFISIVIIALLLFNRHIRVAQINEQQTEELQQADEKKDEFLANTSHELRNPLHGIMNIAQSVLDDKDEHLSDKNKENLNLLVNVGQRMSFTLNDLLDVTRLKEHRITLDRTNVDLRIVARVVLDMIRFMVSGKDIRFKLDIPVDFPKVHADENRLIQILFNLLHNAVKYTNNGTITLSADHKNKMAAIYVKDTGVGMNKETLNRVFQPYRQEDSGITSIGGGTGLGLNICKQFVELHGGEISAESTLGQGSVLSFTLPLAPRPADKSEAVASTDIENKFSDIGAEPPMPHKMDAIAKEDQTKLLIVDDDTVNLKVLKTMLDSEYDVFTATSGEKALDLIYDGEWDLVIADVMMPHMSGYELTQVLRNQFTISELPILLLTARHQVEDINTGFLAGANDYVVKPVEAMELKARVRALTSLKQSIREQLRIEAAWLQSQIRPHFLFNTFNTIASLSEFDTDRMIKLLNEFGNYLRRSFDVNNTESFTSLESELDLTKSYLYIEKERFGDRLNIKWDIEDGVDVHLPPLTIQPLVENAVRHGVLKKSNGGTVTIRVTDQSTHVEIAIKDEGVGMEQEAIRKILDDHPHHLSGIGVTNTNKRLKKLYGKGLEIDSEPGIGTTVRFQIPKKK